MHRYCDGVTRRDALKIGAIGGLSLTDLLRLDAADDSRTRDRNAILIFKAILSDQLRRSGMELPVGDYALQGKR